MRRQWHTIRMGECREDRIKNKVPNRFKQANCGKVHANNQRTFRKTHLDQSPQCGNMDFLPYSKWNSFKRFIH